MKKRLQYFPFIAVTAFFILGKIFKFGTTPLKATTLILSVSGLRGTGLPQALPPGFAHS